MRIGGLCAAAACTLLWIASLFFTLTWSRDNGLITGFGGGTIGVTMIRHSWDSPDQRGVHLGSSPITDAHWLPTYHFDSRSYWWLWVPLWFPAAAAFICAGAGWRLEALARRRTGLCPKCGYSREGLAPSALCPECGSAL